MLMLYTLPARYLLACFVAAALAVPAAAITIDFDDIAAGGAPVVVTDQYEHLNVLFDGLIADDRYNGDYTGVLSKHYNQPIEIIFGNSLADGFVDSVTLVMSDGQVGTTLASYTAYDLFGNELGSGWMGTMGFRAPTPFTIAFGGIHRIVLDDGDGDGSILNEVRLNEVQFLTAVPEPGTALLSVLGLLGLMAFGRRRPPRRS